MSSALDIYPSDSQPQLRTYESKKRIITHVSSGKGGVKKAAVMSPFARMIYNEPTFLPLRVLKRAIVT